MGHSSIPHVRSKHVFRQAPEPSLFPMDIESKLGPHDIARQVKLGLSALDKSYLRELYDDYGGIAYDPSLMLGIVILAWLKKSRSSREIEDSCRTDLRFMYVSGGIEPDYRSILRFLNRIAPVMDELQHQFIESCLAIGFLDPRRIAVDGTKIRSAASQVGSWLRDEQVIELEEAGFEVPGSSDPDARVVRGREGKVLGYNAQAAVDCDTGLVLATEVCQSSADRSLLSEMAQKIASQCGEAVQGAEIVADSGYDSHDGLQTCEDLGFEATVPPQDGSALFWTPVSETEILCPLGEPPVKVSPTISHGRPSDVYRVLTCSNCPLNKYCVKGSRKRGRSLVVPLGCDPVLRVLQAHRARSPEGKEALGERMSTVEPFFGWIKWILKMGRFLRRGLAGARLEFGLMGLARNIKILGRALVALLHAFFEAISRIWRFQSTMHRQLAIRESDYHFYSLAILSQ